MKRCFLLAVLFVFSEILPGRAQAGSDPLQQQVDNLYSFARLYGYLCYFHPSDEAAKVDWDQWLFYGISQVKNCRGPAELVEKLKDLALPLTPTVEIGSIGMTKDQEKESEGITVYWMHKGLQLSPEFLIFEGNYRINYAKRSKGKTVFDLP